MENKLDIYEYEIDELEAEYKEEFKVTDLDGANWCFRKLKSKAEKAKEIEQIYDKEATRLKEWKKKELEEIDRDVAYFEGLITAYLVKEKATDPKFKISTPYGKASTRKNQPNFEYLDKGQAFIDWAKENEYFDLIRVKEEPIKTEVKARFDINEDKLIDKETGEVVEGITITQKPDSIIIKVAE